MSNVNKVGEKQIFCTECGSIRYSLPFGVKLQNIFLLNNLNIYSSISLEANLISRDLRPPFSPDKQLYFHNKQLLLDKGPVKPVANKITLL